MIYILSIPLNTKEMSNHTTVHTDPYSALVETGTLTTNIIKPLAGSLRQRVNFESLSTSGGSVVIRPPATNSLLDTRITATVRFTIAGIAGGGYATTTAPRSFALNRIITAANVNINGFQSSSNPNVLVTPFERLLTNSQKKSQYFSGTPTQADSFTNVITADLGPRSPFDVGRNCGLDMGSTRIEYLDNPGRADTASLDFTVSEQIIHPALAMGDTLKVLSNVRTLSLDLQFTTRLRQFLLSSSAVNTNAITVDSANSYVEVAYYAPSIPIPQTIQCEFEHQYLTSKDTGNLTFAAVANSKYGVPESFSSNVISLSHVPKKIIIWATAKRDTMVETYASSFSQINSISMTINSRSGILAGLNTQGLFNLSCDAGLSGISWPETFSLGYPLVIDMTTIGGVVPNEQANLNISFTGMHTGYNAVARAYELHTLCLTDGHLDISPEGCVLTVGHSMNQTEEALVKDSMEEKELTLHQTAGGSFVDGGKFSWKKLLKFGKKALGGVNSVANLAAESGLTKDPRTLAGLSLLNATNSLANPAGRGMLLG